jgi:GNAT superfamily N-acetyltransferase
VTDEIRSAAYGSLDMSHWRQIAALQDRAYGSVAAGSVSDGAPLHDPALNARSFMLFADGRLVSYAGVVTTTIEASGEPYIASGLSSVAADPDVQRRGFASQVIAAASRHIANSGVDIGVFTCAPHLTGLYAAAGDWQIAPDAVVIGSRDLGALTSTTLGVTVMMRLFSERAIASADAIRRSTIDLGLPLGQFW